MIKNKTKNKTLSKNKKLFTTFFSQIRGLMFSKKIVDTGYIFVFKRTQKIGLHMFFVFYPIDVLFLDKNKKVIDMKVHFLPFTFYTSKKKSSYVIEFPANTINDTNTSMNDVISW